MPGLTAATLLYPMAASYAALVERSANGRLIVAENSGHYIQFEQPDLVIAAVRQLVERLRTGQLLQQ